MNKVKVEILGLSSSPSTGGAYALLLKESYGIRRLPIIIGAFEAQAIALELEKISPPRPLTHDLLKSLVDNLGATITEVVISSLKDNTFFAEIIVEMSSMSNTIDARPSDAIALAVRTGSPIFVNEEVMEMASFIPSSKNEDVDPEESEDEIISPSKEEIEKETDIGSLQEQLRVAIENEDYEKAASLRDAINKIKKTKN
ncbi:MAG: bifunctional nuclease domain-containing protein [Rhodothermaceae bacterium]